MHIETRKTATFLRETRMIMQKEVFLWLIAWNSVDEISFSRVEFPLVNVRKQRPRAPRGQSNS